MSERVCHSLDHKSAKGMVWNQTRALAVKDWRLTAWATTPAAFRNKGSAMQNRQFVYNVTMRCFRETTVAV
jgi:hypothetical protein